MTINVCRLMRDFPSLKGIEQVATPSARTEEIEYVEYGLAPGIYSLMEEQVKLGARFNVIAAKRRYIADLEVSHGIRIHRVERPYDITSFFEMKELNKANGIDIVHAHATSGILYAFLKRFMRRPYVVHVHGTTAGVRDALKRFYPETHRLGLRRIFWNWLSFERQRFMWKRADVLVAVSSNIADELVQFYETAPDKVRIVHNGVDTHFFKPFDEKFRAETRKKLGAHGEPIILYVGHLGARKGLFYLLKAIPTVVKKFPKALFVIVGGIPEFIGRINYQQVWSNMAEELGIQKHVAFVGEVKHRKIIDYYAMSDIFVFPTLYEGLAKALLEAMACGLPIVTTNAGGNADVIVHKENGILIEPGKSNALSDALIRLSSDKSYAKELGKKARETVKKNFTWKTAATKLMKIYEDVLAR